MRISLKIIGTKGENLIKEKKVLFFNENDIRLIDVLRELKEKYGDEIFERIMKSIKGEEKDYIIILNGHILNNKNCLKKRINNGDRIEIYPLAVGG